LFINLTAAVSLLASVNFNVVIDVAQKDLADGRTELTEIVEPTVFKKYTEPLHRLNDACILLKLHFFYSL